MAWSIQGGGKKAAGRVPCRRAYASGVFSFSLFQLNVHNIPRIKYALTLDPHQTLPQKPFTNVVLFERQSVYSYLFFYLFSVFFLSFHDFLYSG
jgi:hypothetical protein